ncbi:MAG: nicotinate phosphoribosyltransferase [Chloroflexi bacterium]|nr:nicotinate phosphoribosyltransferase [Chloroflexota bacterium]
MAGSPRFDIPRAVLDGSTADLYFHRTHEILRAEGRNPHVTMEIFPQGSGHLCGVREVCQLLRDGDFTGELWALDEGEAFEAKETTARISGPYLSFGLFETAILGILASGSGWTTAARECVAAAGPVPVVSFGARHLHPKVADVLDYAAIVGGCQTGSTPAGAALHGLQASGTMPHALILIMHDTVAAAEAFDRHIAPDVARIVLVDTFHDEVEESLRVAEALGTRLWGVRVDTPAERGGVTPDLIIELRAKLDAAGYQQVRIFVSSGLTPTKIAHFRTSEAPIDGFGVGSYISGAKPIDFTGDIREIDGRPVAKRGRLPGLQDNPRLRRML